MKKMIMTTSLVLLGIFAMTEHMEREGITAGVSSPTATNLATNWESVSTQWQTVQTPALEPEMESTQTAWDAMEAPLTALIMAMVERDLLYDQEEFVWTSLYYMIGIDQSMDFRVIDQEDSILVPVEMVQDCAFALFGTGENLPAIPESMREFVSYDQENFAYALAKGDASWTSCVLLDCQEDQGKVRLEAVYLDTDDETVICQFTALLQQGQGMFGYHIVDMQITG